MEETLYELAEKGVLYRPLSERELKRVVELTKEGVTLLDILTELSQ